MRYHLPMDASFRGSDDSVPQGVALREAKVALRRQILARRDELTAEFRTAASNAIAARVTQLPEFAAANAVLLTLAYRSEWSTLPLVRAALLAGKTVAVPRVDAAARMLELHALTDPDREIIVGFQGIPEPLPDSPKVPRDAIDFVLVPGVAFDENGGRLGYGGGYYDRLLPLLDPRAARMAGAFEMQIVDRVPAAPHDVAVDAVVTETRTFVPRR